MPKRLETTDVGYSGTSKLLVIVLFLGLVFVYMDVLFLFSFFFFFINMIRVYIDTHS